MSPLLRQIAYLVGSVTISLVGLASLLWVRLIAIEQQTELSAKLFAPSVTHIARAQHALVGLQSTLYRYGESVRGVEVIPYRFTVLRALDDLDRQILGLVRIAHAHDFRNAFDLPSRAHARVEAVRAVLRSGERLARAEVDQIVTLLDALDGTLRQLERLYGLEQQRALEERQQLATSSFRAVLLAGGLLVLLAAPLITRLALGVRDTVRREARARADLAEATRNLEAVALYDGLTQLGNRRLFKVRLEQAVESAKRTGRIATLMYIDLDDFKRINDSLGHDTGDEVLKIVGCRLVDGIRAADTVARIGGDEFTVILPETASRESAGLVAAKLLSRIQEPMKLAGHEVVVTASIGITLAPADADDPAALMKNADMALYRAKGLGRHHYQYFVEAMNEAMVSKVAMEGALRVAIRNERLTLAYQPQVDLTTGTVTCVEALLRWRLDDGGTVPPGEFIPVAEATGLMKEIGSWVLRQACEDLAHLRLEGSPELRVSVNVSAQQFREPHLVGHIADALVSHGLPPAALEVELTETTLIEDVELTGKVLDELREIGVSIAIDDFGVGYSSLSYLKHLPIDALKIDRSFVRDVETDEADRSIVNAILAMAESLSLRTVAEGIETEWQLDYLASQRCSEGQGFLLSHPVPLGELAIAEIQRRWRPTFDAPSPRALRLID